MREPKILGASRVTISKIHTENPKILGAIVHDLVDLENWSLGFVRR
jgi:hypothetical protein